jgi:hypothetical protein
MQNICPRSNESTTSETFTLQSCDFWSLWNFVVSIFSENCKNNEEFQLDFCNSNFLKSQNTASFKNATFSPQKDVKINRRKKESKRLE